ncbi:MAG TPA: menaquinone biosynthesis protein [Vicinamibacterales bacterium]|nr:menaquinone biosynthesis protein [Vicinamibacterales bacterium]
MLRLGHIIYSNCFPVHAGLIDRGLPEGITLVEGVPSDLNRRLAAGLVDVAPSSSIEFARHAQQYRILPGLVIGARGPALSILLVGRPPETLGGRRVGLTTASATSVALLKILFRIRWKVTPEFFPFDQIREDPFAAGADAALFIGDVALRADLRPDAEARIDLGDVWTEETGLPFAFAVWQASGGDPGELRRLHAALIDSRTYGLAHRADLARRYEATFGLPAALLDRYWANLVFDLDDSMQEGLKLFYRFAADAGELPAAPPLVWL